MADANAVDLAYAVPHPLQTSQVRAAPNQVAAGYDATLTGDNVYERGDLIQVNGSGNFTKLVETTPANLTGVLLAGHDHDQGTKVLEDVLGNKKWLDNLYGDLIPADEQWVFTYQGNAANTVNYTMAGGDVALFRSGVKAELIFNTTEKVMTVRHTTVNPNVEIMGLFKGAVGFTNPRVYVRWLAGMLRGA